MNYTEKKRINPWRELVLQMGSPDNGISASPPFCKQHMLRVRRSKGKKSTLGLSLPAEPICPLGRDWQRSLRRSNYRRQEQSSTEGELFLHCPGLGARKLKVSLGWTGAGSPVTSGNIRLSPLGPGGRQGHPVARESFQHNVYLQLMDH
ncbi:uncharacterized protein LOC113993326 isoform X2 [Pipra filicauda]|nr:uncharacterized protein LOC113993326 isoform X2 [Pipra filicauda]XP_039238795.1 uncharacterized protein LOC113993326 isoform X2 [Pipra filicauda]